MKLQPQSSPPLKNLPPKLRSSEDNMPDESLFIYVLVVIREMCPAQTLYVEEEKSNGLSAYYGAVTL